MDYEIIRQCASGYRVTEHARREMEIEPLGCILMEEVQAAIDTGGIIEEYENDVPYPSCLIFGQTPTGRPLHVVCAPVPEESRLIIITAYQPDPKRLESDWRRRKSQ